MKVKESLLPLFRPDAVSVLKDKNCKFSLSRYFDVFQNKKYNKLQITKKIPVKFESNSSIKDLWTKHESLVEEYKNYEKKIDSGKKKFKVLKTPKTSFLDLKIEISDRIMENCHLCMHDDRPNRTAGEIGYCKCGKKMVVSSYFEHMGEEPELVPSGTIFTCGCSMRCLHCQNYSISQMFESGEIYTHEVLAKIVGRLKKRGCRNINLVGGDPTPWLSEWLKTFKHVKENLPIVWNSNSYYSEETAKILIGFADVYLLDFKYGPEDCAKKLSDAPGYWEACTRNHSIANEFGELIIRILVLPEHLECCTKPILNWIAQNLGKKTRVNILFQYRPEWRADEVPELKRKLNSEEMKRAIEIAEEAGLENFIT